MSIVVASADRQLVELARSASSGWGIAPFCHLKSAAEFHFHFEHARKQIRIFLLDGDLPPADQAPLRSLFDTHPALRSSVRGWIGSSYGAYRAHRTVSLTLGDFHFLIKRPFGHRIFFKRLFEGGARERESRSAFALLGDPMPEALAAMGIPRLEPVPSQPEGAGILLVQPERLRADALGSLKRLRKSPFGNQFLLVCLGREPEAVRPVRTICRIFIDPPRDPGEWAATLAGLKRRFVSSLEIELRSSALRKALHAGNLAVARRQLARLESAHPDALETRMGAGRFYKRLGKAERAMQAYRRAAEIHPCEPEIYSQLMGFLGWQSPEGLKIKEQAHEYCPYSFELFEPGAGLGP